MIHNLDIINQKATLKPIRWNPAGSNIERFYVEIHGVWYFYIVSYV